MSELNEEFATLKAGDVLCVTSDYEILQSVVLRTKEGKEGRKLFLSEFSKRPTVYTIPGNPHRWDNKEEVLVNNDGDEPTWFNRDITIERGLALKTVADYNKIPRSDGTFKMTDDEFSQLTKENKELIESILIMFINKEIDRVHSNDDTECIYLMFKALGIQANKKQIACMMSILCKMT